MINTSPIPSHIRPSWGPVWDYYADNGRNNNADNDPYR